MKKLIILALAISSLFISSCSKEEDQTISTIQKEKTISELAVETKSFKDITWFLYDGDLEKISPKPALEFYSNGTGKATIRLSKMTFKYTYLNGILKMSNFNVIFSPNLPLNKKAEAAIYFTSVSRFRYLQIRNITAVSKNLVADDIHGRRNVYISYKYN